MLYNMENTAMFYKDRKWTMTFAICESLYCNPLMGREPLGEGPLVPS